MSKKKLMKKALIICLSATMTLAMGSYAYASTQALPNGTIVNQNGTNYLTDSKGEKYSGWFKDSNEDWYYFKESDKSMKTGWHHDDKDGYWYYLNLSYGKMVTGWQMIDGKEYFFQPVRDMGNYNFNDEQEKWLYSINSKVPYGAMYVNTTTPDGSKVDITGAKVVTVETINNSNQDTATKTVKNGWVFQNKKWQYYESDVIAKTKWLNLSGKWYYVADDGVMISNAWKEIGGKSYYFGSDGAMYANTITPDGKKVGNDGSMINGNSLNYSDFIGTYYGRNLVISNFYAGVEYKVNITKIENGYIYGNIRVETPDDWYQSDFSNGVKLVNTTFAPMGQDDEGGEGNNLEWQLKYKNGNPVIRDITSEYDIPKSISSNLKTGTYTDTNSGSYQWWEAHAEEVEKDSRIHGSTFEMEGQLEEYYPDWPGGRWEVFVIDTEENSWGVSMDSVGGGGFGQGGGSIIITSSNTATLNSDYSNKSLYLKVINDKTIEINGSKYSNVY